MVDEEVKYLEVVLKRRGYLGETSFVSKYTTFDFIKSLVIIIPSKVISIIMTKGY